MGQNNVMHDVPKAGKNRQGFGHRGGLTERMEAGLQREPRRGRNRNKFSAKSYGRVKLWRKLACLAVGLVATD